MNLNPNNEKPIDSKTLLVVCSPNRASQISDTWRRWHLLLVLSIPTATPRTASTSRPGKEGISHLVEAGGVHSLDVAPLDGGFPGLVTHIWRKLSHLPLELPLLQLQLAFGYLLVLHRQQMPEPEQLLRWLFH